MSIHTIRLEQIKKSFNKGDNDLFILYNVNLAFKKGASYAIVGKSGIGKSTLLHIAAGFDNPTQGTVYFDDQPFLNLNSYQRDEYSNKSFGFVFQEPYLIGELTVVENVMIKGIINGLSKSDALTQAKILLEHLDLSDKEFDFPSKLSGGQQQRVALARALVNRPDFLFADEPTGNLDENTGEHIMSLLYDYQKKYGMGIIMSTHNMKIAQQLDELLYIENRSIRCKNNEF